MAQEIFRWTMTVIVPVFACLKVGLYIGYIDDKKERNERLKPEPSSKRRFMDWTA